MFVCWLVFVPIAICVYFVVGCCLFCFRSLDFDLLHCGCLVCYYLVLGYTGCVGCLLVVCGLYWCFGFVVCCLLFVVCVYYFD